MNQNPHAKLDALCARIVVAQDAELDSLLVEEDALRAECVAYGERAAAARAEYGALVARLREVEAILGFDAYLTDSWVDHENVIGCDDIDADYENCPNYWRHMVFAAGCAAGCRSEELGIDINTYFDKPIY